MTKLISSPTVNSAITGGSGVIEGNYGRKRAGASNADRIRCPAFDASRTGSAYDQRDVGLYYDALSKGVIAGIIGIVVIMLFMIFIYRLPGLMSCIALLFYIVIMFFCVFLQCLRYS